VAERKTEEAGAVTAKWETAKKARRPWEKEWALNLSYFLGYQWVHYNEAAKAVQDLAQPSWRKKFRQTVNRIFPRVRTAASLITKTTPRFVCVPNTLEEEDIAAARIAQRFLSHFERQPEHESQNQKLVLWFLVCGTAFRKIYWEPDKGPPTCVPRMGNGDESESRLVWETARDGTMCLAVEEAREGEVAVDVCSAFEIYPDPLATCMGDARYIIQARFRPMEYIEARWGRKVGTEKPEVPPIPMVGVAPEWHQAVRDIQVGAAEGMEGAVVLEYWEQPNKQAPEGAYRVVASGELLAEGPLPYRHLVRGPMHYPYVPFYDQVLPSCFWGMSIIQQERPIQTDLNRRLSQLVENAERASRKQWKAPKGSVDPNEWTTEPGAILEYNPRFGEPVPIVEPAPPPEIGALIQFDQGAMEDISGVRRISQGAAPPGVTAGVAMAFLQEQDETDTAPVARAYERSLGESGVHILALAREFYSEERMVLIVGRDGALETQRFKAADIESVRDVRVQAGSALPQSRAGRTQVVLDLVDRGLLDATKGLQMLEFAQPELEIERATRSRRLAEMENNEMEQGQVAVVQEYHDHPAHLDEHDTKRNSMSFRAAPPVVQKIFHEHVREHKMFLAAAAVPPLPETPDQQAARLAAPGPAGPAGLPGMEGAPIAPPVPQRPPIPQLGAWPEETGALP